MQISPVRQAVIPLLCFATVELHQVD